MQKSLQMMTRILSGLLLLGLFSGCYVFSSYQNASILERGGLEVTPSYSTVNQIYDTGFDKVQDNYGIQVGYGLAEDLNLRARYETVSFRSGSRITFLALGPKLGRPGGKIAFDIPFGLFIGEDVDVSESYQIHPTLLFSYPPTRMFETTAAVKLLYIFKEVRDECLLAINLGCGISHAPERYWLRPEVGWSYDFDHGWINMYFGVGLSLMLLK